MGELLLLEVRLRAALPAVCCVLCDLSAVGIAEVRHLFQEDVWHSHVHLGRSVGWGLSWTAPAIIRVRAAASVTSSSTMLCV